MRLGGSLGSQGLDMSKPLLNGSSTSDVDAAEEDAATMVAAIQDHIASCTKLQDTGYTGIEIKEERFPCDFDHMYASMAEHDSAAVVMEVRQLKELLLCHLDLIQQQSEQLVNKDKQLQNLRQENEMLRQRLERMDRRVTLHHNKRQSGDPPTAVGGTPNSGVFPLDTNSPTALSEVPGTGSEDDGGSLSMQPFPKAECSLSPRGSPLTVNSGAKQPPPPQQPQQPPAQPQQPQQSQTLALPETRASRSRKSSWSSDTGTAASRRSGGSVAGSEMRETRSRAGTPNTNTSSISKRLRTSNRRPANDTEVEQPEPEVPEVEVKKQKVALPVSAVKTPVLYYCPGEASIAKPTAAEASSQALLEVPSWRIRPYTSCYSMEGTENLEDEVFLKRHNRLELDERRRKRWDIQRLREQRQYEKLRQRQMQQQQQQQQAGTGGRRGVATRRNTQQQKDLELWPDPEHVQFIEVDEFLPVTAFGVPVPAFLPTLFELSWSNGKEHFLQQDQDSKVQIKQEPKEETEVTPAPPPPSPDLPPPPPPQQPPSSRNRRRSRASNCSERRRTSARRR